MVEDNVLVLDAIRVLLDSAGYRVLTASTVAETLDQCASTPVDVMLLDLSLPDGSGLDAIASLRAAGTLPRVTVALTGHDDADLARRCREAGCRDVLLKPVPARELIARVAEWYASA